MPQGAIVLLQYGETCSLGTKFFGAQQFGAERDLLLRRGGRHWINVDGDLDPVRGGDASTPRSALANGVEKGATGLTARVKVDWRPGTYQTSNVIAETRDGDPNNVIVVGAHLDSVGVGPGINDNGSGSATILEIAEQIRKVKPRNKVRFIWFGAEEHGLLGLQAYVDSLPQSERDKIAAMLNFDMVGSPNFVRFVYDGDLSDSEPPEGGAPAGSADIERLFLDYFESQGLATEPTAFDGRSDYGPVHLRRHPGRSGLFTGAEEHQDRGAGGDLRRHRGRAVRPLLPPGLRQPGQPQQRRARPDERRRRARHDHAGAGPSGCSSRRRPRAVAAEAVRAPPAGTRTRSRFHADYELSGAEPPARPRS